MHNISIAVIGGSGVYQMDQATVLEERHISTPWGDPSERITLARVGECTAAFLPRHGKGHRILPSEVNSRANIYALKSLGVKKIISISAVGSLKEEIRPTDLVLPAQLIDKTHGRPSTYFGQGAAGHVPFADPFCEETRTAAVNIIRDWLSQTGSDKRLFSAETYVCMEGPQFSTRAESELHRSWGAGVIGMTALPEAKLAREAELCYITLAMATDYDCWKADEAAVDVAMVMEYMKENNRTVNALLPLLIQGLSAEQDCACATAAQWALMTPLEMIPPETRKRLELFYGKYWKN